MRRNVNSSSEKPADSIAAQLDQFLASSKKERTESHQQIEKLFEINKVQSDCIVGLRKTVNLQADVLDMKQSRIEALEAELASLRKEKELLVQDKTHAKSLLFAQSRKIQGPRTSEPKLSAGVNCLFSGHSTLGRSVALNGENSSVVAKQRR